MSVKKQPNGSYRAFVNRVIDGKRRPMTKCFATEKEAKKWEGRMRNDDSTLNRSLSFRDLTIEYVDSKRGSVEESTLSALQYKFEHFMAGILDKKVSMITPPVLNKWRNEIVETSYSIKYKNEIIKLMCSIFHFAAAVYYIKDPALNLKSVKTVFEGDEDLDEPYQIISPQEFQRLYDELPEVTPTDKYIKALIMATWSTGMRRGEVKAIQWKNYSELCFEIRKASTGKQKGDRSKLSNTKTKTSRRRINVDAYCDSELKRLLAFAKDVYGYNENWFMFGGMKPIANTVLQDHFFLGLVSAGMVKLNCPSCKATTTVTARKRGKYREFNCPQCGESVKATHPRFHDLRHSHATLLLDRGIPISAVSSRLGHSSITQTTKTYLHASKSAVNALIEKLPDLHFGNNSGNNKETDIKKTLN